jgi:hypothetical protein
MCANHPLHAINIRKNVDYDHCGCHAFANESIDSSPFVGAVSSVIIWRQLPDEEKPVG